MDFKCSQAVVVQFRLFKKGKSSEFDLQDTSESPRDPLSQQAAHLQLRIFQLNMKIYPKIHGGPNSPLILRIFIFQLFQLKGAN